MGIGLNYSIDKHTNYDIDKLLKEKKELLQILKNKN